MTPEQFIKERTYLVGVSPKTACWYEQSFKRFAGALDSKAALHAEHGRDPLKIPRSRKSRRSWRPYRLNRWNQTRTHTVAPKPLG
jgi:hypothetical protein